MIWGTMSCRGAAGLYLKPSNTTINVSKYVKLIAQREAETAHACPLLHDRHARWRSFVTDKKKSLAS